MSSTELPIRDNKLIVKAVTYKSNKTPLTTKEIELPVTPGSIVKPTELLVRVKATSINPIDCILKGMNKGWLGVRTIGGDFSGVVVRAGEKSGYKEGEKIYGDIMNFKVGSSSEYTIFDTTKTTVLERIPEGLSYEEAAALPIASGTAYECLSQHKGSLEGANVLVLGSGTSVGTFAVEMAKHHFKAAKVVATCSPRSAEKVTKCGADLTVDYTKGNASKINGLLEFVKVNGKFDIVVDAVRDESVFEYFVPLLKTKAENGVLTQVHGSYTIDYSNIRISQFLPSHVKFIHSLKSLLKMTQYHVQTVSLHPNKQYGKVIDELHSSGKLFVPIDSINPAFTDAQKAYEIVASGKANGKVVLKL